METALPNSENAALKCVWQHEAHSRSDIARLLHLSRPTASLLVRSLISKKMITEDGSRRPSGGKPAIQLKIDPGCFHSIGIDIGYEDSVRALLLDAAGNILDRAEVPASSSYSDRVSAILKAVGKLRTPVTCGVGLAISGTVDPLSNRIIYSAHFELTGKPLAQEISGAAGLPVYIDNRARMAARAEMFAGAASGVSDFLLVSLGKGIGSALSLAGKLYCGVSGKAGEIRNITVPDYSGCGFTTFERALSGDILEQQDYPFRKMAEICASGFRQVLNIADIRVVILSGRFALFPETFREELQKFLPESDLRLSQFGRDSGACGSAVAAAEYAVFSKT